MKKNKEEKIRRCRSCDRPLSDKTLDGLCCKWEDGDCIGAAIDWAQDNYPGAKKKLDDLTVEAENAFYAGPWWAKVVDAWLLAVPRSAPFSYLDKTGEKFLYISAKAIGGNAAAKREIARMIERIAPLRHLHSSRFTQARDEQLFYRKWADGLSTKQLAAEFGINRQTVLTRCRKALYQLSKALAGDAPISAVPLEVKMFFQDAVVTTDRVCSGCHKPREKGQRALEVYEGLPFHHRCLVEHQHAFALDILQRRHLANEEITFVQKYLARS